MPKNRPGVATARSLDRTHLPHFTGKFAARAPERGRYAPDEFVFQTTRGMPIHSSNFERRVWQPTRERAGLFRDVEGAGRKRREGDYRFHELRPTCTSRLTADGAGAKLAQAVTGHASVEMTLGRHSHLTDERIAEMAHRFDPAAAGWSRAVSNVLAARGTLRRETPLMWGFRRADDGDRTRDPWLGKPRERRNGRERAATRGAEGRMDTGLAGTRPAWAARSPHEPIRDEWALNGR
jgi:hypothetical protein